MKIVKLILVIIVILVVLFLGGAMILPAKQYFAKNTLVESDPVAVFTKLSDTMFLWNISPKVLSDNYSYKLTTTSEYDSINYVLTNKNLRQKVQGGFLLSAAPTGTEVTWYMEMDSLSFPVERWSGFLTVLLKKNFWMDDIDRIESEIVK